MIIQAEKAVQKADKLVRRYKTRDPEQLARELDVTVMPRFFVKQKGVYKIIERCRFIFIKADMDPVMYKIVLLHELGHDVLHRSEAIQAGGFQEFNIFDMKDRQMEYEANIFAAQISLPDEEILDYIILHGYDVGQVARAMHSDVNLVALKVADLNRRGYSFCPQETRGDFLKY